MRTEKTKDYLHLSIIIGNIYDDSFSGAFPVRADPELVYPFEPDAGSPLPVGRDDLSGKAWR